MIDFTNPSDTFILGLSIGLLVSLVVTISTIEVGIYRIKQSQVEYQRELDAEFERQRLEAEGWINP